jgi:GPI-anchor transamidase subunit GAA1
LFASFFVSVLVSNTSFLGHICAVAVGYLRKSIPFLSGFLSDSALPHPVLYRYKIILITNKAFVVGLGYLKVFAPPEKILRWIERKLNLLGRLPHYVSVDQKTYGRYGVLPTSSTTGEHAVPISYIGSAQRLGP